MISIKTIIEQGGFDFNGVWITDIYYDETGRFEVDPREYYNINFKNELTMLDENAIERLKTLFPYKPEYDPDKYMEEVMDYIYSEIVDELIK